MYVGIPTYQQLNPVPPAGEPKKNSIRKIRLESMGPNAQIKVCGI